MKANRGAISLGLSTIQEERSRRADRAGRPLVEVWRAVQELNRSLACRAMRWGRNMNRSPGW